MEALPTPISAPSGQRRLQIRLSRGLSARTEVVLMIVAASLVQVMALLLSRGEDVFTQVRNYVILAVVCRADDRSVVILVDVLDLHLHLALPLGDEARQEHLQVVPSREFYIKSDSVFAQTQSLHRAD